MTGKSAGDGGRGRRAAGVVARVVLVLAVLLAVLALLFEVVFPWFDRTFVTNPVLT